MTWSHCLPPLLLLALLGASCRGIPASAQDLRDQRDELVAHFTQKLSDLAAWCDERNLPDEAEQARRLAVPRDLRQIAVPLLSGEAQPAVPATADDDAKEFAVRCRDLTAAHAEALFELARQAAADEQPAVAVDLLLEAAHCDPDHAGLRKLLGYERQGDRWRTEFELQQENQGRVWHDRYGWLPADHVARYEQGQRYSGGRWVDAAADSQQHATMARGWKIVTEHYRVTTNAGLEEGVALASRLERLYRAWRLVFLRFYASDAEIARVFAGERALRSSAGHDVDYFRTEDEYRAALRGVLPETVRTAGFYSPRDRRAYFFAAADGDISTQWHEGTHQLFSESRNAARDLGRRQNFWVIEGVACYMESLVETEGAVTLGGTDAQRYRDAQHRLLVDDFFVPLDELCEMGLDDLQRHPQIGPVYSQASGLTHFLMHYEGGRYRDALARYLEAVYRGKDAPGTLAQSCGQSYEELEQQYRQFMTVGAEPAPAAAR
jgi:hypothetical protein